MEMSPKDYKLWLEISSKQILYMTEEQTPSRKGYARDLFQTHQLDTEIFPHAPKLDDLPRHLNSTKGNLSTDGLPTLGFDSTIFPLANLIEGLAFFCRHLERKT